MTITKQDARDLIGGKATGDLVLHDDVLKGPGENEGIERYCIVEHTPSSKLYRFIYEEKNGNPMIHYKEAQLTEVSKRDILVSEYIELDFEQVENLD